MGIGLSVSRSIIERHGGRMWTAGNEGPGSVFRSPSRFSQNKMTDAETAIRAVA